MELILEKIQDDISGPKRQHPADMYNIIKKNDKDISIQIPGVNLGEILHEDTHSTGLPSIMEENM